MRILTTVAQVRRVAGIEGPGDFPLYPYTDTIPREVGQALIDGLAGVDWPADRDFVNDDGGWIQILDRAEEFSQRPFGFPEVSMLEDVRRVECRGGETWWLCLAIANNETTVDYAFRQSVAPPEVLAALIERAETTADEV